MWQDELKKKLQTGVSPAFLKALDNIAKEINRMKVNASESEIIS